MTWGPCSAPRPLNHPGPHGVAAVGGRVTAVVLPGPGLKTGQVLNTDLETNSPVTLDTYLRKQDLWQDMKGVVQRERDRQVGLMLMFVDTPVHASFRRQVRSHGV